MFGSDWNFVRRRFAFLPKVNGILSEPILGFLRVPILYNYSVNHSERTFFVWVLVRDHLLYDEAVKNHELKEKRTSNHKNKYFCSSKNKIENEKDSNIR